MNLELTLAGQTLPWRMEGSTDMSTWLRGRPWLELGGVKTVRAARGHLDDIMVLIRREARAADDGASDLRIWRLREESLQGGIRQALEEWLNVSPRTEREFLRILGEALEVRPVVFLGWLGDTALPGELIDGARRVAEAVPKLGFKSAPTFVLLHQRRQVIGSTTTVLDTGFPLELAALKKVPGGDLPTAWRTYLHLRVAWEAGGDVEQVLQCDPLGLSELKTGDDEACESLLNQHARKEMERLPAREREQAVRWLEETVAQAPVRGARPGMERGMPAPWMARALLLEGRAPTARQFLQARLVCMPLAELLLTKCLEIEALQRTRLMLQRLPEVVPSEVLVRFERFQGATPSMERELYPATHPAPPNDSWAFATLGEFMENLVGLRPSVRRSLEQLRLLRNAVAHGHYVGWKALTRLWQTEQELEWG
jgi:hypothetical protein